VSSRHIFVFQPTKSSISEDKASAEVVVRVDLVPTLWVRTVWSAAGEALSYLIKYIITLGSKLIYQSK